MLNSKIILRVLKILNLLVNHVRKFVNKNYMGKPEKKQSLNSFIYANYAHCPLICHFSYCDLLRKILQNQKRCL